MLPASVQRRWILSPLHPHFQQDKEGLKVHSRPGEVRHHCFDYSYTALFLTFITKYVGWLNWLERQANMVNSWATRGI